MTPKHDPSSAVEAPRDYDRLQTALGLVSEAYELLNWPETNLTVRDWNRAATTLLTAHGITQALTIPERRKKKHDDDRSRVPGE